jgi:hypothetical protein
MLAIAIDAAVGMMVVRRSCCSWSGGGSCGGGRAAHVLCLSFLIMQQQRRLGLAPHGYAATRRKPVGRAIIIFVLDPVVERRGLRAAAARQHREATATVKF